MELNTKEDTRGQFVKVSTSVGVVVFLENENGAPDEHLGIWYGELTEDGTPKYRTVPAEYCIPITDVSSYH